MKTETIKKQLQTLRDAKMDRMKQLYDKRRQLDGMNISQEEYIKRYNDIEKELDELIDIKF